MPRFLFPLASTLWLVCGCGSSNSVSADQACTDLAQARCDTLSACSAADLARRWADEPTCVTREKLACTEALSAPHNSATPAHDQSCADALVGQDCPDFLSGVAPPAACAVIDGTAAIGAPCSHAGQCQTGFCAMASDALCGTCQAQPVAGDSCATQGCGQDMACVASTMQCQVPVAAGGACSKDLPCTEGQACVGSTPTAMGTCMAQGTAVGTACDNRLATAANCSAAAGLACDAQSMQCTQEPLAAAGQPCGVMSGVTTACSGGATCQRATGSATGTCVAHAADGAACDATNGPDCETPAKCVAGTCQLPDATAC